MRDRPPLTKPSSDARAGMKDAARMLRHGVRKAGKELFEPAKGAGSSTDRATPSLSGSMRELALAADRLAARTEKRLTSLFWPGETAPMPAMQPEVIRAVLLGKASDQISLSLMRQLRQWLKHALALVAQSRAIILEKPLRDALLGTGKHEAADVAEAAAQVFDAIRHVPAVRISSLSMKRVERSTARTLPSPMTPEIIIERALACVTVAMLAAASRQSKAPQQAGLMLDAAHALIADEPAMPKEQSELARRLHELAALV
jgi:hypothetical protein